MSLKISYSKYPCPYAPDGFFYAAVLPVNIARQEKNAPRSKRFEGMIDSGASQCMFHANIGRAIGLEVEKGECVKTSGVAGPSEMFLHDISVYLPGGIVTTRAGFSHTLPVAGLLGMTGFFEHFKITFDPAALQIELERLFKA